MFLSDAKRFILNFLSITNLAPLQLYSSALLFSPKGSVIRNKFQEILPSWVSQLPIIERSWSPCLQTLEGHAGQVLLVAFSVDGCQLASGSGDKTIKIWDTTMGALQQTLEGHTDWVRSVAFSADGRQLASGSDDKTIKI